MRVRKRKLKITGVSGRAGLIASFMIGLFGLVIGGVASYVAEHGAAARAKRDKIAGDVYSIQLRYGDASGALAQRAEIVKQVLAGGELARLPAPKIEPAVRYKPKIILIIDDVGIDRKAFARLLQLPGEKTLSFLPYANDVAELAARAREAGASIMLHLPMEPNGPADPGPNALRSTMSGIEFLTALDWNLSRIDEIVGVNNHMGSKLTEDRAAMVTVLAQLREAGLFFLDSVTTSDSVARAAGKSVSATVFSRDVFLDPVAGDKEIIRQQLRLAERIAEETGYVVLIGHPRAETLDVLEPWLVSASLRGFDLAPVTALYELEAPTNDLIAQAPDLRF